MLVWLATWLKQIIAVVLLAGLVDLLLPNKAMQRYVRLVAGLIVLLTILTLIIRLLQGDFDTRLKASLDPWLSGAVGKEYQMPSLEEIQNNADKLRRQQQQSAAVLAERRLASQMGEEVARQTGVEVSKITVRLETQPAADYPAISDVQVALVKPHELQEQAGQQGDKGSEQAAGSKELPESNGLNDIDVEPVQPVMITVESEGGPDNLSGEEQRKQSEVDRELVLRIKEILQQGWAVPQKTVNIYWASE